MRPHPHRTDVRGPCEEERWQPERPRGQSVGPAHGPSTARRGSARRSERRRARRLHARTTEPGSRPPTDRIRSRCSRSRRRPGCPELVPIRYGRMLVSPFTFYRGAARDHGRRPRRHPAFRPNVQLCGDAHLSNFGVFGSPERQLMFDINDFDETLPGPWEWDVKRLAASFEIAGRDNGFADGPAPTIVASVDPRVPRGDAGVRGDGHPRRSGTRTSNRRDPASGSVREVRDKKNAKVAERASRRPGRRTACRRSRS